MLSATSLDEVLKGLPTWLTAQEVDDIARMYAGDVQHIGFNTSRRRKSIEDLNAAVHAAQEATTPYEAAIYARRARILEAQIALIEPRDAFIKRRGLGEAALAMVENENVRRQTHALKVWLGVQFERNLKCF